MSIINEMRQRAYAVHNGPWLCDSDIAALFAEAEKVEALQTKNIELWGELSDYHELKEKCGHLTESNRQLREELHGLKARITIKAIERICLKCTHDTTQEGCPHCLKTALAADRKLLCRLATFLTQCDSSSPKVPELIADIEKSLSGVNEHHELTTRTALAAAKEALLKDWNVLTEFGEIDSENRVGWAIKSNQDALALIAASEKEATSPCKT